MGSFRLALRLSGVLAVAACAASETGPQGPPNRTDGATAVFLTDAPFPFDGVTRVDIHIVDIALSPQTDTSDGLPGWVTVATPDQAFNLLDLQNGSTALLGEAVVPPGQYRAVRVTFDPARSSITDAHGDRIYTAATPGTPGIDWQSKEERPVLFAMVEEAMAIDRNGEDIVIDFDVGRSFLYDGNGGFTFLPWIRAITRAGSGSIAGQLTRADNGAAIPSAAVTIHISLDTVAALGPMLATTRSDATGRFMASFLRPGRYQVVAADLGRDLSSAVKVVEVTAGRTADAGEFRF
ncbi:MAG: DUF4382 domain-containing protein [Gemmatimonadales bacterium]